MDCAAAPWVRSVTFMASTQVGKTEAMLNAIAYLVDQNPGPLMIVQPTREDGEAFGEHRVLPMIEASPTLRAQLGTQRWDAKKRRVRFRRCTLWIRSARVASELASTAVRDLFGDEADKWATWTQREAGPWELARERGRTFLDRRAWLFSTPTVPDGLIAREYAKGDRRRFHLPCPHCGHLQVLSWGRIKWADGIETEQDMQRQRSGGAWYLCEHCGERITDRQKVEALQLGLWVPTGSTPQEWMASGQAADRAAHRSYWIWCGYSPWLTWADIVAQHLRSRGDPAQAMNFCNSWLAEPWQEKVEDTTDELVQECRRPYARGSEKVPEEVHVLTAGVDTQARYLPYVVRGWGVDGNSWLADTGRAETFEALASLLFRRAWQTASGRHLVVALAFIDARYRYLETIEFAREWSAQVRLSKGVEFGDARLFAKQELERHPTTGAPLPGVQLLSVNTGAFKDRVALAVRRGAEGATTRALHIYQDIDPTYVSEVSAEHKVTVRNGERTAERWVKKPGRRANHSLDAEALAFAAAELLRVDLLRASMARENARAQQQQTARPAQRGGPIEGPNLWRRR